MPMRRSDRQWQENTEERRPRRSSEVVFMGFCGINFLVELLRDSITPPILEFSDRCCR